MRSKLHRASAIAVTATLLAAIASAQGSGALARDYLPADKSESPSFIAQPIVQPLQADAAASSAADAAAPDADTPSADSLADLVSEQAQPAELPQELRCLAGAIYFEAKSESLPGQLAVGRVIVNRSKSGRFPASYCGVVYQPSQFSFVRGRGMPVIKTGSQDWHDAVAIAQIADAGSWRSPAEGALFFHAARVSPNWHLTRIARVENHVFYR